MIVDRRVDLEVVEQNLRRRAAGSVLHVQPRGEDVPVLLDHRLARRPDDAVGSILAALEQL